MNQINWKNILSLLGLLLFLINFSAIKGCIKSSSPFIGLNDLPEGQRYLVILGIILIAGRIVHELKKPSN